MDFFTFIVHVFTPQTREFYSLERLWGDAERIEVERYAAAGGRRRSSGDRFLRRVRAVQRRAAICDVASATASPAPAVFPRFPSTAALAPRVLTPCGMPFGVTRPARRSLTRSGRWPTAFSRSCSRRRARPAGVRSSRPPRRRVRRLLGRDPAAAAAVLRRLRRSAAVVARSRSGTVCRRAADRRPHIAAGRAVGDYDGPLRAILHALKYDGRRSLAAPLGRLMRQRGAAVLAGADCVVPVPLHWRRRWRRGLQSGARPGRAARAAGAARAAAPPAHAHADRPARRRRAAQRPRRLRRCRRGAGVVGPLASCSWTTSSTTGATLEACARVLMAGGRAGGADAYSSPSRDATACRTSALTSSFGRSPRISTQPASAACALIAVRARGSADRGRVRSDRGRPPCAATATSGAMSSRIVRSAAGRKRWMSASHARIEPLRFAVGDARRRVAIAEDHAPLGQPAVDPLPRLVAVGDVEQLHDVGAVVALAVQRPMDLARRWRSRSRETTAARRRARRAVSVAFSASACVCLPL